MLQHVIQPDLADGTGRPGPGEDLEVDADVRVAVLVHVDAARHRVGPRAQVELERELDAMALAGYGYTGDGSSAPKQVTKEDKVASYEVALVTADKKKLEATFDVTGKFIEEEKEEPKEEKK